MLISDLPSPLASLASASCSRKGVIPRGVAHGVVCGSDHLLSRAAKVSFFRFDWFCYNFRLISNSVTSVCLETIISSQVLRCWHFSFVDLNSVTGAGSFCFISTRLIAIALFILLPPNFWLIILRYYDSCYILIFCICWMQKILSCSLHCSWINFEWSNLLLIYIVYSSHFHLNCWMLDLVLNL